MATDDVKTSGIEESTVSVDTVGLRRDINDAIKAIAPEIDPTSAKNIPAINALQTGAIEYMNSTSDSKSAAKDALKENIENTLKNGPTDSLAPRAKELYDYMLSGLSEGKFVNADTQAKEKKKESVKTSKQNAAVTRSIIEASYSSLESMGNYTGIDPRTLKHLNNHLHNNWTQQAEEQLDSISLIIKKMEENGATPEEIKKAQKDLEDLYKEMHDIMKDDPKYLATPPEHRAKFLEAAFIDRFAEKNGLTFEEAQKAYLEMITIPKEILEQFNQEKLDSEVQSEE